MKSCGFGFRKGAVSLLVLVLSGFALPASAHSAGLQGTQIAAVKYANCAALNKVYPHGVGRTGARDKVSGKTKPVTNFTRNDAVYRENIGKDRDGDGVACEKR